MNEEGLHDPFLFTGLIAIIVLGFVFILPDHPIKWVLLGLGTIFLLLLRWNHFSLFGKDDPRTFKELMHWKKSLSFFILLLLLLLLIIFN